MEKNFLCTQCHASFTRSDNLTRHQRMKHGDFIGFQCSTCQKTFSTQSYLSKHMSSCNTIGHTKDVFVNYDDGIQLPGVENDSLEAIIHRRWGSIQTYFKCQNIVDIFNFRLYHQRKSLKSVLTKLWNRKLTKQVKLQCSIGSILQNKKDQSYRYFHSSANNTGLFSKPQLVKNVKDLNEILTVVEETDLLQHAISQRPDSAWSVVCITNITFNLTKLQFPKFGSPCHLPIHIKRNKSIQSLISDAHSKMYDDNLCFFRALALAKFCKCSGRCVCLHALESKILALFKQYAQAKEIKVSAKKFRGVPLNQIGFLENLFQTTITIYSLNEDGSSDLLRESFKKYQTSLNLCAYNSHFCYIRDVNQFCSFFQCQRCQRGFKRRFHLKRHNRVCAGGTTKRFFPNGFFRPKQNIFEEIYDRTGIFTPYEDRFYPFRATFDIECFFKKPTIGDTAKIEFTQQHELMSISFCSNVSGFDKPLCFVSDGDSNELVEYFVEQLNDISDAAYEILVKKFDPLLKKLLEYAGKESEIEHSFSAFQFSSPRLYNSRSVSSLIKRFLAYLSELPVVGFNSSKYDLNVIKTPLIRHLLKHDSIKFSIKRNRQLKCLKTQRLKFLDITNYIAPGFNYAKFVTAFDCLLSKGFFPYEYIDSLEKLKETSLPPHSAFYSSLKQKNITADEYRYCETVWRQNKMHTLVDFLVWYNNLDVVPFLEALEKQSAAYKLKNIDFLKDGVSVPSIATRYLFQESDQSKFFIPLIDQNNSDLYDTLKRNIVGGPSIVFHRYHEQNKTKIRGFQEGDQAKLCDSIVGFDANALYLHSAMQEMPTGFMIRRKSSNRFLPQFSSYYGKLSLEWLEYVAFFKSIHIEHKFNVGEKRIGQHALPVDGFHRASNTVYQFHGCLFHGCPKLNCSIVKNQTVNPINLKSFSVLHQETILKQRYLQSHGYKVISIYECMWNDFKKTHPQCQAFVTKYFKDRMAEYKPMTPNQILDGVRDDRFFGLVECDISVPENLKDEFAEMLPIFKNCSLSQNDLSAHMKEYAQRHKILSRPQRALVGSYFATKVLLLTPLLKWYLSHGLEVTKIYQITQYNPIRCFKQFGESVCQARRLGDVDASKTILAETAKLSGNCMYGVTITNKERFTNVKYVTDPNTASAYVNAPEFLDIDELADDVYEVNLAKKNIKLDTPIIIGFCILQYAKLRMLQFYYDFMCLYFNKCDFQYVCMDTDSAYMAITGDFESLVKPSMKYDFYSNYDKWFPPPFCDAHKHAFINAKLQGSKWTMLDCCSKNYKYHLRTPGLFKLEFSGSGIIALNSKTYYSFGHSKVKMSTKGIMKHQNKFQKRHFLKVLKQQKIINGRNRGFLLKDHKMLTYSQVHSGLNYFYAKRHVHTDGVTTFPTHL